MKIIKKVFRNNYKLNGEKANYKKVNLEWWNSQKNLGDYLSKVVYEWMLKREQINSNQKISHTIHLLGIGSILGMGNFDAVVWGSGIHTIASIRLILDRRKRINYDIRLVRGPITRAILKDAGYVCPKRFGDPAVLMPLIYTPKKIKKVYKYGIIKHLSQNDENLRNNTVSSIKYLNIKTLDYKSFINSILQCETIISSSLHGIILAESYGVPAIFLSDGVENEIIKYIDWYLSTNRTNIKIAKNIEDAFKMKPMELPNLEEMQKCVISAFPYDLWEKRTK